MCRLKKERRGTPKQVVPTKKRQTGVKLPSRSIATTTKKQRSMVPDLYSMGLPYEDIVALLGIDTNHPAAYVRRLMKQHEQNHAVV